MKFYVHFIDKPESKVRVPKKSLDLVCLLNLMGHHFLSLIF